MTKNQKIAAGCGGLGCLGLIVAVIVGGCLYYYYTRPARLYNGNITSNSNSNRSGNANESTNSSSSNSSNETASSYSDDDKHKLWQAASMTQDQELIQKVVKKTGLFKADGTPSDDFPQFIKEHFSWAINNAEFINSVNTPEKARAYVDAHL